MRSRYSAFFAKNMEYILATTDPQTVLDFDMPATLEWAESAEFTGLEILRIQGEGNKGLVEFKATYRINGGLPQIHHEIAKFRKQAGRWYFREGKVTVAETK